MLVFTQTNYRVCTTKSVRRSAVGLAVRLRLHVMRRWGLSNFALPLVRCSSAFTTSNPFFFDFYSRFCNNDSAFFVTQNHKQFIFPSNIWPQRRFILINYNLKIGKTQHNAEQTQAQSMQQTAATNEPLQETIITKCKSSLVCSSKERRLGATKMLLLLQHAKIFCCSTQSAVCSLNLLFVLLLLLHVVNVGFFVGWLASIVRCHMWHCAVLRVRRCNMICPLGLAALAVVATFCCFT